MTSLERLHLYRILKNRKPRKFVKRFPKLRLLDIFYLEKGADLNEILGEVRDMRAARRPIQFYYEGVEVSNERSIDLQKTPLAMRACNFDLNLKRLLLVASKTPGVLLPFFYFREECSFGSFLGEDSHSIKRLPYEFLQSFRNILRIEILNFQSYEEIRSLLVNLRQLLRLQIHCNDLDEEFFDDLPGILENLICISISGKPTFESLAFLDRFNHLLYFEAKFEKNPKNQQIVESIEERKNSLTYPMVGSRFPRIFSDIFDKKKVAYRNLLDSK